MQLGVTITEKDMDVLRSTTRKTKMYSRAKEQMQRGMTEYMNNGALLNPPFILVGLGCFGREGR